jgi:hypothetical protein
MSTLGTNVLTLEDLAKRLDPNDGIAKIVELVAKRNEMLADMTWKEGNLITGEKTTIRTGLPTPTWRQLNYGVVQSKSTTAQIMDSCGMLEGFSKVDKALAELNGNTAEFRLTEDMAYLEAMSQQLSTTVIYGDTRTNPERFMGLAPRFSSISTDYTKSGYNVIDAGGRNNANTSIWVVVWGANTAYGIYPKGSKAGWTMNTFDNQPQVFYDTQTPIPGEYVGYRTHYKWDCGLTVRDWRYVARIANIDVAALLANTGAQADLSALLTQATERIWNLNEGRVAIYCTRDVRTMMRIQAAQKPNTLMTFEKAKDGGEHIAYFAGIPVRRVDALLNTEANIIAVQGQ